MRKFAYLWEADFEDGTTIKQPKNDRSKHHVVGAEHNPSAFRDLLDKMKESRLLSLALFNAETEQEIAYVNVATERPCIFSGVHEDIRSEYKLDNIRPIYWRRINRDWRTGVETILHYELGFQGTIKDGDRQGENYQRTVIVV